MQRKLRRLTVALTVALIAAPALAAQGPVIVSREVVPPNVIAGDGWEAFPEVEYLGGDAGSEKKQLGVLVLTDSALSLYACADSRCLGRKTDSIIKGAPLWTISLRAIKEISSSTSFKGTSTGSKLLLGGLAGDKSDEQVGIVYETARSAEAPVFKTRNAQAAAIEAKVKFRLSKLGVVLREKAPR